MLLVSLAEPEGDLISRSDTSGLSFTSLGELTAVDAEIFDSADVDENGLLDRDEFVDFRHPEYSGFAKERFAAQFIEEHDMNGDGVWCSGADSSSDLATAGDRTPRISQRDTARQRAGRRHVERACL